ncbi:MAG: hypothetical protein DRG31_07455 [Deltaproteobacteria bacterium]|nr:MAG: hypothetical protein DRG31_07455 [Deltaproteobacteria bacterium]
MNNNSHELDDATVDEIVAAMVNAGIEVEGGFLASVQLESVDVPGGYVILAVLVRKCRPVAIACRWIDGTWSASSWDDRFLEEHAVSLIVTDALIAELKERIGEEEQDSRKIQHDKLIELRDLIRRRSNGHAEYLVGGNNDHPNGNQ